MTNGQDKTPQVTLYLALEEPSGLGDCESIAAQLQAGRCVIVNVETLDVPTAQGIVDAVDCSVVVMQGILRNIREGIYIAAPSTVALVDGDLLSDAQTKEMGTVTSVGDAPQGVVLMKPTSFLADCESIANHLRAGYCLVLDLEALALQEARRVIDFTGGAAFSLGGTLHKAGASVFVALPSHAAIVGDLLDIDQPEALAP